MIESDPSQRMSDVEGMAAILFSDLATLLWRLAPSDAPAATTYDGTIEQWLMLASRPSAGSAIQVRTFSCVARHMTMISRATSALVPAVVEVEPKKRWIQTMDCEAVDIVDDIW